MCLTKAANACNNRIIVFPKGIPLYTLALAPFSSACLLWRGICTNSANYIVHWDFHNLKLFNIETIPPYLTQKPLNIFDTWVQNMQCHERTEKVEFGSETHFSFSHTFVVVDGYPNRLNRGLRLNMSRAIVTVKLGQGSAHAYCRILNKPIWFLAT